ncbi:hypothetical protein LS684_03450 [Cytobacillus spongiae]|uniref:hypothetical protein n=1 Tax=Cytobacillus spongiae TaxID=2901381 RepID=UPI001F1FBDBC|nr:hypothetical protein [Cytobacillus spongiae]UII56551.1 hypothetical protein LS684_03450 [Cytobacillus spongiae]
MSFFKNVFETGKILVESGKELGGILSQGRKEFTELMTDGFKEMVIKGNNNYKSSYQKIEEAERIVSKARYHYDAVFGDVQLKLDALQQEVEAHYKYKVGLYEQLKKEYSNTVENFLQKYKLKKKEYQISTNRSSSDFDIPFNSIVGTVLSELTKTTGFKLTTTVASKGIVRTIPVTLIALDLIEQSKRVKDAEINLSEAKKFRARIDVECERLKKLKSNLYYVEETMNEERRLIQRLLNPLKKKMEQTDQLLNSSLITKTQLTELEVAISIIAILEKTLTTEFLQDSALITEEYQNVIKQLLEMENQIYHKGV